MQLSYRERRLNMSQEKEQGISKNTKVIEWIKLLTANEQFLDQIGKHENLVTSIRELKTALRPFEKYQYTVILDLLTHPEQVIKKSGNKASILDGLALEQISLEKLKILSQDGNLSKKELLLLADKTLKMPTGTLKKMKKEMVQQKILNVIQNSEKLDTIGRQAAK